jgi:hypothetical protein
LREKADAAWRTLKAEMGRTRTTRFRPIVACKIGGTFIIAICVPGEHAMRRNNFLLLLHGDLCALQEPGAFADLDGGASI